MSNPIQPSVTFPSPLEWPPTVHSITNITRDRQARITSASHGFTGADVNITSVMFTQVKGMIQINSLPAMVSQIVDTDNFLINLDTTFFYPYFSAGQYTVLTGEPPVSTVGQQIFNTPYQNVGLANT